MWVLISGLELAISSNYDDDDLVEQLFTIFNWHSIFNAQTQEFVCITRISFLISEKKMFGFGGNQVRGSTIVYDGRHKSYR